MDKTEWIVFLVVAIAGIYLAWELLGKNKKKGGSCCKGGGCGEDPKTPK